MLSHMKTHQIINEEPSFHCELCNKSFHHEKRLICHVNKVHSEVKDYKCELCGKEFAWIGNFKRHMRVHTGAPRKMVECDICHKEFRNNYELKNHMNIHAGIREKL